MITRPHEKDQLFYGRYHDTGTDGAWHGHDFHSVADALDMLVDKLVWEIHDESEHNLLAACSGLPFKVVLTARKYIVEFKDGWEKHRLPTKKATFAFALDALEWATRHENEWRWSINYTKTLVDERVRYKPWGKYKAKMEQQGCNNNGTL